MDFEKAYDNYKAGTATDEEIAFVEGEIAKAKKLTEIIDTIDSKKDVFTPTQMKDVRRAQKKHSFELMLRTTLIVVVCLIVSAGAICGGIFGQAVSSANKNTNYSAEQAKVVAIDFVKANYTAGNGPVFVTESDRELKLGTNLKHSVYVYYIDVQNGANMEIDVMVNAQTGLVTLIDVESD